MPEKLEEPLRWRKPRRIFVNSMSDLFHEGVPDEYIDRVFAVMASAQRHTFQVLTKRPERMANYLRLGGNAAIRIWQIMLDRGWMGNPEASGCWPIPNVYLGVSVENQATADERIPLLLQTPAAVRFISAEPLLEPVSFRWAKWHDYYPDGWRERGETQNHLDGLRRLDWVIIGGESGHSARACNVEWIREIVRQCDEAGVPPFVKQVGSRPLIPDAVDRGGRVHRYRSRLIDRKGSDPSEWPHDLRRQEWPTALT